jgi:hypothetical protein
MLGFLFSMLNRNACFLVVILKLLSAPGMNSSEINKGEEAETLFGEGSLSAETVEKPLLKINFSTGSEFSEFS